MLPTAIADIIKRYVIELVKGMSPNWESIVVYTEFLRSAGRADPDGVDTGMYVAGGEIVRNFRTSLSARMVMKEFFLACEGSDRSWSGIRVEIFNNGKYKSDFYYESTPLLDGNFSEVDRRIESSDGKII